MAHQHVLDLRRVDVLGARDDHVLDAVVQVEPTVPQVARVAGAEPAVSVDRLGGRRRVAASTRSSPDRCGSTPRRRRRRRDRHPSRDRRCAVRPRPTAGRTTAAARAVDGSWSSARSVVTAPLVSVSPYPCMNLQSNASNSSSRTPIADRRCAVDDGLERRRIRSPLVATRQDQLEDRRHQDRMGDPVAADVAQDRLTVDLPVQHDGAAEAHHHQVPPGAGDVEERRHADADHPGVEPPHRRTSRRPSRRSCGCSTSHPSGCRWCPTCRAAGRCRRSWPERRDRRPAVGRSTIRTSSQRAWPSRATMRVPGSSSSSISSTRSARSAPTNRTAAAASVTTCAISRGASRQLTQTQTALSLAAPKSSSKYSGGSCRGTPRARWRSTPAARIACAT